MGFSCEPEPSIPPFFVPILLFFIYIERAGAWVLHALGLLVLVNNDILPAPSPSEPAHHHQRPLPLPYCAQPVSASRIRQVLPSVRYEPPPKNERGGSDPHGCAVCLHELEADDEVLCLESCRYFFHTHCINQWVDIGRRTCPSCRTQIVPRRLLREAIMALRKVSGDVVTDLIDFHSLPSEPQFYDDGLYDDDGNSYRVLQDTDLHHNQF